MAKTGSSQSLLASYYQLTKPGIIYGNLLTALAGFLLAAKQHVDPWLLLATLSGTSLVIASACIFNNFIDRDIDRKMARTKNRALASGLISTAHALSLATLLGLLGFAVLAGFTNWLTLMIGGVGFIVYVALYAVAKRRSVHGTLVGSISGAAPIVAGYCAVTGRFDEGALILFLILALWQMPHFYAIALYRQKDYAAARVPVLAVSRGARQTKWQISTYIGAFTLAVIALASRGYTGYSYLLVMSLLSLNWMRVAWQGFSTSDERRWARKIFFHSLIVLLGFCVMLSLNALLP